MKKCAKEENRSVGFRSGISMLVVFVMSLAIVLTDQDKAEAAPVAPAFSLSVKVTKITEGTNRAPGNKVQAIDGANIYTAYTYNAGDGDEFVRITRSTDSGATWDGSHTVARVQPGLLSQVESVAVSGDAVYPTQKIIHVVWEQADDSSWASTSIYYSWADDASPNSWSVPVKINGSVLASSSWARLSIVTSRTGAVHVLFQGVDSKLYYTTADSHESYFAEPVALPGNPSGWQDVELTIDSSDNLHCAFPITDDEARKGLQYTRKPAGSGDWTTPVTVAALAATGQEEGFTSITAYDANNIFVTNHNYDKIYAYRSTNGGATWSRSSVFSSSSTVRPTRHISIAVSPAKVLYVGTGFDIYSSDGSWLREEARIFKSTDGGITWSTGGVIAGQTSVSIGIDTRGKAAVNLWGTDTWGGAEGNCIIYFTKEK